MSLTRSFSRAARKLGMALSCLTLIFMAACGPAPQHLGATAKDPGLRGTTAVEMVYKDAGAEKILIVEGGALKSESRYVYNGTLVIRGDVPAKTEIDVTNGKLEVTGNVGDGATLDVRLPVRTHTETDIILMPMTMSCGENCTTTYLMPMPMDRTVEDGLAHPGDYGPAVKVDGTIGNKVTVTTNGGIHAGHWGTEFKAGTGYGRTLEQTQNSPSLAKPAAPAPSS